VTILATLALTAALWPQLMHRRSDAALWGHALSAEPDLFHTQDKVGCVSLFSHDLETAERHFKTALGLFRGSGLVAARLAALYAETTEFQRARRCIDQAILVQTDDRVLQWGIDRLQAVLDARPRSQASRDMVREGLAAARSGDFRSALGHFVRAADADPATVEPCTNAGLACLELRDPRSARRWFQRAVDNAPFAADGRVNLAKLLLAEGDLETAIMRADIATRIDPDDGEAWAVRDAAVKRNGGPPRSVTFDLDAEWP